MTTNQCKNRSAVDRLVAEGNEAPKGAESVGGYRKGKVKP